MKIGNQTYKYELKILGANGGYRLYGNIGENGQVIFTHLERAH